MHTKLLCAYTYKNACTCFTRTRSYTYIHTYIQVYLPRYSNTDSRIHTNICYINPYLCRSHTCMYTYSLSAWLVAEHSWSLMEPLHVYMYVYIYIYILTHACYSVWWWTHSWLLTKQCLNIVFGGELVTKEQLYIRILALSIGTLE